MWDVSMCRCRIGVFTGLHDVAHDRQVVHVSVLLCLFGIRSICCGGRGSLLGADRLRSHGGVVGLSVLLRADWLLWLLWLLGLLHAAGRLGGAGAGGHQTVKMSVEGRLKAGGRSGTDFREGGRPEAFGC